MASTLPPVAGNPFSGAGYDETVNTAGLIENGKYGLKVAIAALKVAIKYYNRYKDIIDEALNLLRTDNAVPPDEQARANNILNALHNLSDNAVTLARLDQKGAG